jgi:hypothetical protein
MKNEKEKKKKKMKIRGDWSHLDHPHAQGGWSGHPQKVKKKKKKKKKKNGLKWVLGFWRWSRAWGWLRPPHTGRRGWLRPLGWSGQSPQKSKTHFNPFFFFFFFFWPFEGDRTTPLGMGVVQPHQIESHPRFSSSSFYFYLFLSIFIFFKKKKNECPKRCRFGLNGCCSFGVRG